MAKACVAYVHEHEVSLSFAESLLQTVMYDASAEQYLAHADGKIAVRCATGALPQARNSAAKAFLATDAEWIYWVDTDMAWAPDTLARLIEVADPETRPIVGALCFSSREVGFDGLNGYRTLPRPTLYDWLPMDDGHKRFVGRTTYPVNELVRCSATGSACLVVHRSVYERINAYAAEHGQAQNNWYECVLASDGGLMSEDISFCARAAVVGAPTHVHTGVKTTHYKPMWLGDSQFWMQYQAPPATERTAVLVPVLGRPEHAEPFMRSLRASTGLATAYAICDTDDRDAILAWRKAGARVINTGRNAPTSFAVKANIGYRRTREPWLFVVGSDVHFWPAWLDHAQHVADEFGASVVGTNDLGHPAVMAGEHATHMLVSRKYVAEVGASWDGPGVLAHEGYAHNFIDNEIVVSAKQRGAWQMALGSRVEHLHPMWDKGESDDVYERGLSSFDEDHARFMLRLRLNGGTHG